MKLKVPFFKQMSELNCGFSALKMVLAYFGEDFDIERLEKETMIKEGKAIFSIQIATASASLGHKTDFYSKHIFMNEENFKLDFYKKYAEDNILSQSEKLVEDARKAGVHIHERKLSIEKLLLGITKDSIPIILLDWNIVMDRKEKGYQGHFVPVVGYDKEKVYIHNHGLNDTQEFMSVPKDIFDEARKAEGTDEDIVIIHRKSSTKNFK